MCVYTSSLCLLVLYADLAVCIIAPSGLLNFDLLTLEGSERF